MANLSPFRKPRDSMDAASVWLCKWVNESRFLLLYLIVYYPWGNCNVLHVRGADCCISRIAEFPCFDAPSMFSLFRPIGPYFTNLIFHLHEGFSLLVSIEYIHLIVWVKFCLHVQFMTYCDPDKRLCTGPMTVTSLQWCRHFQLKSNQIKLNQIKSNDHVTFVTLEEEKRGKL